MLINLKVPVGKISFMKQANSANSPYFCCINYHKIDIRCKLLRNQP